MPVQIVIMVDAHFDPQLSLIPDFSESDQDQSVKIFPPHQHFHSLSVNHCHHPPSMFHEGGLH